MNIESIHFWYEHKRVSWVKAQRPTLADTLVHSVFSTPFTSTKFRMQCKPVRRNSWFYYSEKPHKSLCVYAKKRLSFRFTARHCKNRNRTRVLFKDLIVGF